MGRMLERRVLPSLSSLWKVLSPPNPLMAGNGVLVMLKVPMQGQEVLHQGLLRVMPSPRSR